MPEILMHSDDVTSVEKAAADIGVARVTIYKWIDNGKIKAIKLGGTIYIPVSEIARLKEST